MKRTLAALLFACWALPARADSSELSAKLECDPAPGVGRVRCSLKVTPPSGGRLAWVDALVVKTPEFARALRSRVAPQGPPDPAHAELLLGLVASGEGSGVLSVRARAVVCPTGERAGRCRSFSQLTSIEMRVGSAPRP